MAALADLASHELLLGGRLALGEEGSGPERGEAAKRCTGRKPLHAGSSQQGAHAGCSRPYHALKSLGAGRSYAALTGKRLANNCATMGSSQAEIGRNKET